MTDEEKTNIQREYELFLSGLDESSISDIKIVPVTGKITRDSDNKNKRSSIDSLDSNQKSLAKIDLVIDELGGLGAYLELVKNKRFDVIARAQEKFALSLEEIEALAKSQDDQKPPLSG